MQAGHDLQKAKALEAEVAKREEALKAREAELAAREQEHITDPVGFLTRKFGPDFYDKISKLQLDGSLPAQTVAAEMRQHLQSLEKKFTSETERLREEHRKELEKFERAEMERRENEYYERADSYLLANKQKYPNIFEASEVWGVQPTLRNFIQGHLLRTTKRDEITGEEVPGELLTPEQAADAMEKLYAEKHEQIAKRRSALPPLAAKPEDKGAGTAPEFKVVPSSNNPSVQRRTLSTSLTGSSVSSASTRPLTEKERYERYSQRWDELLGKRQANA